MNSDLLGRAPESVQTASRCTSPHKINPLAAPCLASPMLARRAARMSRSTLAALERTRAISQHMHASTQAATAPGSGKPQGNGDEVRSD